MSTVYMLQPWYKLLRAACEREDQKSVASRLGVSESTVSQVVRGSGHYGTGKAKTDKIASKVLHKFGSYPCPHLTEVYGEERVITADECRSHAHRATAPIGSPGLLSHWRACAVCPHKAMSAPADKPGDSNPARPPRARKPRAPRVAPVALATTAESQDHEDTPALP